MTHRVIVACATLLVAWATSTTAQHHDAKPASTTVTTPPNSGLYVCPMHPKVTSSKPGECPECGMDLVKQKTVGAKKGSARASESLYACPMHPKVTSSKPGECPECGMDLVKQKTVRAKKGSARASESVYACPMHPKETSSKPGSCSKCGMNLVKQKPKGDHKGMGMSKQPPTKDELIAAGSYNCCVERPCDECYKGHQSCNCYKNAKTTKEVCKECGEGWKKGEGRVPGVHPDSIKATSHSH